MNNILIFVFQNFPVDFNMDPLHCGSQVHSYPKTEMYNDLCPVPQVPNLLPVKQEFQSYSCMKSMGSNYSLMNRDYSRNMNILLSSLSSGECRTNDLRGSGVIAGTY